MTSRNIEAQCAEYRLALIFYASMGGGRAKAVLDANDGGEGVVARLVAADAERRRLRARVEDLEKAAWALVEKGRAEPEDLVDLRELLEGLKCSRR